MKTRKSILAAVGAAALGAATIAAAGMANAAPVPVTFQVTGGSLSIGTETLPFPDGSSFSGTWDDETGALSGNLTVPQFSIDITDPLPLTIGIQISQVGAATGNISPETGAGTLNITLNVSLLNDLLPAGCGIQGITLSLSTSAAGGSPLNFETGALALGGSEFEVPAASGCGELAGIDLDEAVSGALGLPTNETSVVLQLQGEGSDDTTTTTPTTIEDTTTSSVDTGATLPPTGSSDSTAIMAGVALLMLGLGGVITMAARRRGVPT